jgi:protoporphyrinogen oxidase
MLGGTRWPDAIDTPDDVLRTRLLADLDGILGLDEEPKDLGVTRWQRAIPQPGRDHVRRIAEARERLATLPGLELAGGYVSGVSVADSFASGLTASAALA